MILNLLPEGDPSLLNPVPVFDFGRPPCDAKELAANLVETMKVHKAFGLAANQCGLPYRVFVLEGRGEGDAPVICFNPEIDVLGDDQQKGGEGCLSFPGLVLEVERPLAVQLHYQSDEGERRTVVFSGLHARGAQHELDHLNGIVFTSHVSKLKLERAKKKRVKGTR